MFAFSCVLVWFGTCHLSPHPSSFLHCYRGSHTISSYHENLFTKRSRVLWKDFVQFRSRSLAFTNGSKIWQAPRQRRCRDACQISEWYNHYKILFCGIETSRDHMARRPSAYCVSRSILQIGFVHPLPWLLTFRCVRWCDLLALELCRPSYRWCINCILLYSFQGVTIWKYLSPTQIFFFVTWKFRFLSYNCFP